jgi:hypothetical protein
MRINTVNPHAVFDTGIWTEDVLRVRATVRQDHRRTGAD